MQGATKVRSDTEMEEDLYEDQGNLHIKYLIPVFSAGLFLCCMLCHGELARRRPRPGI